MISKTIEIRDIATFIPTLAVRLEPGNSQDRYLLGRAGFGTGPEAQRQHIYLIQLNGGNGQATCDPYDWSNRTMQYAHLWLNEHFDEIESGGVVDVEYVTGNTTTPKQSERGGQYGADQEETRTQGVS